MQYKTCSKCKKKLKLNDFYKNKNSKDGFRYICRCCSEISKKDDIRRYNKNEHRTEGVTNKICSKCKKKLEISNFWKNKNTKDGFQCYCKDCTKVVKERDYARYKEQRSEGVLRRKDAIAAWWKEYKKRFTCQGILKNGERCQENHPACIQFHHPNKDKDIGVSDCVRSGCSKERILQEVAKCIPLCANCHCKLHWENIGKNLRFNKKEIKNEYSYGS